MLAWADRGFQNRPAPHRYRICAGA